MWLGLWRLTGRRLLMLRGRGWAVQLVWQGRRDPKGLLDLRARPVHRDSKAQLARVEQRAPPARRGHKAQLDHRDRKVQLARRGHKGRRYTLPLYAWTAAVQPRAANCALSKL